MGDKLSFVKYLFLTFFVMLISINIITEVIWANANIMMHVLLSSSFILSFSPMLLMIQSLFKKYDVLLKKFDDVKDNSMIDNLTKLPNRTLFYDRAIHTINMKERSNDKLLGIIMMDLDGFKVVNEALGHNIGDELLIQISKDMQAKVRSSDTLARTGGDEFAIIVNNILCEDDIICCADRISKIFDTPFMIKDHKIDMNISMGLVIYQYHGADINELLINAEFAMYTAKREGCRYILFNPEQRPIMKVEGLSIIGDIRKALKNNEFKLYFQPKKDLKTNSIVGVECLLRWEHPERGFIPPYKVIPLAENSGLINSITDWVLEEALKAHSKFEKEHGFDLTTSINISTKNLQNSSLLSKLSYLLSTYEINPRTITLEITETSIMLNQDAAIKLLFNLQAMGVNISIDDFGTGHSSLLYLKRLPAKELKIDRSFVSDISKDGQDKKIVKSTIDLAHAIDFKVVAEGVENKETETILKDMGCDEIQGYYLTNPLSYQDFVNWLKEYNS